MGEQSIRASCTRSQPSPLAQPCREKTSRDDVRTPGNFALQTGIQGTLRLQGVLGIP